MKCLFCNSPFTPLSINQKYCSAADVKPVVRGKWELLEGGKGRCPNCRRTFNDVWDYDASDAFCRGCGADMREGHK